MNGQYLFIFVSLTVIVVIAVTAHALNRRMARDMARELQSTVDTLEVNTKVLNEVAGRDHVDSKLRDRIEATIADNVSTILTTRRKFNFDNTDEAGLTMYDD
jgi:hypothetical protein